jgi:hypothetical protein
MTTFVTVGKHTINLDLVELLTQSGDEVSIRFADSEKLFKLQGDDATLLLQYVRSMSGSRQLPEDKEVYVATVPGRRS